MVSAPNSGSSDPDSSPSRGPVLFSLARHLTLMVPLSTHLYKWVPIKLNAGRKYNPAMDLHPIQGGV